MAVSIHTIEDMQQARFALLTISVRRRLNRTKKGIDVKS